MNWIQLESLEQLENIKKESENATVLIFKHSTRCSTSRMTLDRLERNWDSAQMKSIIPYYLDLISFRQVSNAIADSFGVEHESPQVLLISKGESYLDLSHFEIQYDQIRQAIKN
jgi:bacillithiol system protein YtxJ